MKFSAVVTRYFSFIGLSQNNPKWEGSEEVSCSPPSVAQTFIPARSCRLSSITCMRPLTLYPARRVALHKKGGFKTRTHKLDGFSWFKIPVLKVGLTMAPWNSLCLVSWGSCKY